MKRTAFFLTGTDTGVGKTVISAWLTQALGACYWKPVQAGLEPCSDTAWVQALLNLPEERIIPERYVLGEPLSPHLAARIDGVQISLGDFSLGTCHTPVVVEGAGGILVPLNDTDYIVDLITRLELPVIVVARSTLGTINHTCLTLEALRTRGIDCRGVILNGEPNRENANAIEKYGRTRILAEFPLLESMNREALARVEVPEVLMEAL